MLSVRLPLTANGFTMCSKIVPPVTLSATELEMPLRSKSVADELMLCATRLTVAPEIATMPGVALPALAVNRIVCEELMTIGAPCGESSVAETRTPPVPETLPPSGSFTVVIPGKEARTPGA